MTDVELKKIQPNKLNPRLRFSVGIRPVVQILHLTDFEPRAR